MFDYINSRKEWNVEVRRNDEGSTKVAWNDKNKTILDKTKRNETKQNETKMK